MTTLITGGAGFIGSRLALRLLELGDSIVIYDNFDGYYDPTIKRGNIEAIMRAAQPGQAVVVEGDVRDQEAVEQLFTDYPIRRVTHLAAMAGVRYSAERGRLYADVNTGGTVTLMDTARKHAVEAFVMGSTSSVYGNTQRVPFQEDNSPDLPLAPYPASKRSAELFAHSYHNLFNLNVTVLQFFNVYGPHGRPDMMPMKAIDSILNEKPITIWDGGMLQRDWTYIDDTVNGVIAAIEKPMGYQIINLGCGAPVTLIELIQIYEDLIGKRAILQEDKAPLTEPRITYCDNTRAREKLGFVPQMTLREGLSRTWAWYQERYLNPAGGGK